MPGNLIYYALVLIVVALIAARLAVWMFPMQAPAQSPSMAYVAPDGPGVVVEPGAKLLHRSPVF